MALFENEFDNELAEAEDKFIQGITVHVENEDDVPFWHYVFKQYAPHQKFKIDPSVRGDLSRGKKEVLKMKDQAGAFKLLCIDSDYEYLFNGHSTVFNSIQPKNRPFIFQTYAYAIENYKCFAKSLEHLCVQATLNNEQVFDFIEFFKRYSSIVYPLFLYSVYFAKFNPSAFTITDFSKFVELNGKINASQHGEKNLQQLDVKVKQKIAVFKTQFPNIPIHNIEVQLRSLGITSENCYLFIRGHEMFTTVSNILKSVEKRLRTSKFQELNIQGKLTLNLLQKKRAEYKTLSCDIEVLLRTNTRYDSCFLMEKIKQDVERYLQELASP